MAATPTGRGYWILGSDGGIFTFGDALFAGSVPGLGVTARTIRLRANPGGPGYWVLGEDGGIFWTVEGTQTNSREAGSGACTEPHTTFDWAEFDCEAVRLRFEVEMRLEGGRYEPLMGQPRADGTDGSVDLETHEISLPATTVDGAVLTVVSWVTPTPEPGPDPVPEPGPGPDPVPPVDSSSVTPSNQ